MLWWACVPHKSSVIGTRIIGSMVTFHQGHQITVWCALGSIWWKWTLKQISSAVVTNVHKELLLSLFSPLEFHWGTYWRLQLVDYVVEQNVFAIEPEWGQLTVTVYAIVNWCWTQNIHTGGVVYITGQVGQGKLFNRGAWVTVWDQKNMWWLVLFPPKHLSWLHYAVSFSQSAVRDPQTIAVVCGQLYHQRTLWLRTCTHSVFLFLF